MELKEIAQYLHDIGLVTFDETGVTGDVFIGTMPDDPDECVAIYQNAGTPADPKNQYRQPAIQFIVRSINGDQRNAMTRAQSILDALNGFNSQPFVVGGKHVIDCTAQQSAPAGIGTDQNNRHEFSFNFLIQYKI